MIFPRIQVKHLITVYTHVVAPTTMYHGEEPVFTSTTSLQVLEGSY